MRVLITGATGFLGPHLCRKLTDEGLDVVITCRHKRELTELEGLKVEMLKGDITNLESLVNATEDIDSVFHLAGVIEYSRAKRALMEKVNVGGTFNIIEACKTNKVRRLVHLSSVVTIGASIDGRHPLNENSEYNIQHLDLGYFETKRAAEKLVLEATRAGAVDAVILNPSTIYGPGDAKKGSRNSQLKVAQGRLPFYTSGGVNVVNYNDVTSAIVSAWKIGRSAERYILAGENITIKRLFEIIAKKSGVEPPKICMPNAVIHTLGKVGDIMERFGKKGPLNSERAWTSILYHWFDSTKAQTELGLKVTPAEISIAQSVDWSKQHGLI